MVLPYKALCKRHTVYSSNLTPELQTSCKHLLYSPKSLAFSHQLPRILSHETTEEELNTSLTKEITASEQKGPGELIGALVINLDRLACDS